MTFSNQLTAAEVERLALLLEELGEAQQVIGKILRHGYASYHPDAPHVSNRQLLEAELGDVKAAVELMLHERDVLTVNIDREMFEKLRKVQRYLHHQPPDMFAGIRPLDEPLVSWGDTREKSS